MARTKRKPYNPALAAYQSQQEANESAAKRSRVATEFNRGIARHIGSMDVEDPLDGSTITVARQTRNDPLAGLHARKSIDEAQYQGGRAFQSDFETAERGPCAIDPSKEFVDGGKLPEPITESMRKAVVRLNRAERQLGADGSAIVHAVLISGFSIVQVGHTRGLRGERWEKYFGMRFRECLDCLALVYGFAMEKR